METPQVIQVDSKKTLEDMFAPFRNEVVKYTASAKVIKIDDSKKLEIAKGNLKQLKQIKDAVKELHERKKKPALLICQMIDEVKRTIDGEIDSTVSLLKGRIASYQEVQKALANEKALAEKKALEEKRAKIEADKAEIYRMARKMQALTEGGTYYEPNGQAKIAPVPNEIQLQGLRAIFLSLEERKADFDPELHKHWDSVITAAVSMVDDRILAIQNTPVLPDEEEMPLPPSQASQDLSWSLSKMESHVNKSLKNEEKAIDKDVKDAGKGLYTTLEYNVVNETEIPQEFYAISWEKVAAYLKVHKERILGELGAGKSNYEIIPGLHVTAKNNVRT